jgi:hypothetical protein
MGERILLRGSLKTGWFRAGLVLAGLGVLVSALCFFIDEEEIAIFAAFVAVAGALYAGIFATVQKARRLWLEVGEGCFTLTGGPRPGTYAFDDVEGVACMWTTEYPDGILRATRCTLRVWTLGGGPVVLDQRTPVDTENEVGALAEELTDALFERSKALLAGGGSVLGEGWELRREGLFLDGGTRIRFGEVAAVEVVDGQVCIWKTSEETPSLRVSVGSRNSAILGRALAAYVEDHVEEPADTGGWGRVLFERKDGALGYWLVALLCGGGAGWLAAVDGLAWMGLTLLGPAALFVYFAVRSRRCAFRCHEYGVCQIDLFSERRLRYDEVGSFTYSGTRMYVNGAYSGTNIQMRFDPREDVVAKPIKYGATVRGMDVELEGLREHISAVVGLQMAQRVNEGLDASWTRRTQLTPAGIVHRPASWGRSKEPIRIPYDTVGDVQIDEGVFQLWQWGDDKALIREQISEPNFFPGLVALQLLVPDEEAGEEEAADRGDDATPDAVIIAGDVTESPPDGPMLGVDTEELAADDEARTTE